jgi:hypothetical protein
MAQVRFWDPPPPPPPAFLPLSGGGVQNPGCTSSTAQISVPGSTVMKEIQDPPCLSTFKRRGGLRNQTRNSPMAKILTTESTTLARPASSAAALCLSAHGPLSHHITFQPPFSCRHVLSIYLSFMVCVAFPPFLSSTYHLPRVSFPPRQPPPKRYPSHLFFHLLRLSHFSMCPICNPSLSPSSWPHHFVPVSHLLRCSPHISFELVGYSRWLHGRSSMSIKCRVGRAILNPDVAVIEVVGGG